MPHQRLCVSNHFPAGKPHRVDKDPLLTPTSLHFASTLNSASHSCLAIEMDKFSSTKEWIKPVRKSSVTSAFSLKFFSPWIRIHNTH